ncbi:MAG: hypothetical protein N0E48_28765 [Candidatus Thiodiazotropha endolucinida]|nr:hypothetical protein [Candidatus Thiodiazotropha endolucinida]
MRAEILMVDHKGGYRKYVKIGNGGNLFFLKNSLYQKIFIADQEVYFGPINTVKYFFTKKA